MACFVGIACKSKTCVPLAVWTDTLICHQAVNSVDENTPDLLTFINLSFY